MVGGTLYAPFLLASIGIIDPSKVGGILAIAALCSLLGSGSYGFVHKFMGTRRMVQAAPILSACGCLIVSFASSPTLAALGLGLISVGLALFGASAYAAAVEAVGPAGDSGAATSIMSFAIYLPQIPFPMLANVIGTRSDPPSVYVLLLVLPLLAFAIAGTQRRQNLRARQEPPEAKVSAPSPDAVPW